MAKSLEDPTIVIPGDSWATTADSDGHDRADSDIDLCELEVASDTDLPQVASVAAGYGTGDMFDFDDLPDEVPCAKDVAASVSTDAMVPEHFARRRRMSFPLAGKPVEVAMLINGSRGDVQPFVALAQELGRRGRRAVILTNHDFMGFCESAGVEAVSAFASWSALFEELGGLACPDSEERKPIPAKEVLRFMHDSTNDERAHSAAQAWRKNNPGCVSDPYETLVGFQPSIVLYCLQSQMPAVRYEHLHKVPAVPIYFTSAFGPHFSITQPARPSLFAVSRIIDVKPGAPLDVRDLVKPGAPMLAPLQENSHITGAWLLDEKIKDDEIQLPQGPLHELENFLKDGDKPVAIGWGSMVPQSCSPISMLELALKALRSVGKRGVILGGWAKLHELGRDLVQGKLPSFGGCEHDALKTYAKQKVFFSASAPHSWLLPHCCCIVHHGGAGTTQAAIRAVCPSVITPVYGDQFHFAQRVQNIKAGVGFQRSLNHVTDQDLAKAINRVLTLAPPKLAAKHMQKDEGCVTAADILEDFLNNHVHTGMFLRELEAINSRNRKQQ